MLPPIDGMRVSGIPLRRALSSGRERRYGSGCIEAKKASKFDREVDVQILREAGVPVDVSCEEGVCGTSLTKSVTGEPIRRDFLLSDAEREDHVMSCRLGPKSAVRFSIAIGSRILFSARF